ncbi:MAG TPA: S41 family peptidase [Gemmatimonadaceae bacterium]|nr:S41 family peptidase [Gemmatimonadaceae bacterium]
MPDARRAGGIALALALALGRDAPAQMGTQWRGGGSAVDAFSFAVSTTEARAGGASLRISADAPPDGFATLATSMPAESFVGRRLRLTAHLRTAALEGQGATVWLRADTAGGSAAFATTQGRVLIVGTTDWTPYRVEIFVPPGSRTIALGAVSLGRGTLWLDDARLEVLSAAGDSVLFARSIGFEPPDAFLPPPAARRDSSEAPRALTARAVDNLVAFARLASYVRFFHPTDEALATDWDAFTVRGVRAVERAPTADSLAATLRALFAGIAPTVVVRAGPAHGIAAPRPPASSDGAFWVHCGVGPPTPTPPPGLLRSPFYRSNRVRVMLDANGRGRAPTPCPRFVDSVSAPAAPLIADLGGGVSAVVPHVIPAAGLGAHATWRPVVDAASYTPRDRAMRLATVALLWMVPQHFYPYFDVVGTDWAAELRRALGTAATDAEPDAFLLTLQRMAAALHDGHASVQRTGAPNAIAGLRLAMVEGRVLVTAHDDSATAAGVRRGDEVIAVEGRPVPEALREIETRVSAATAHHRRQLALARLLTGHPGSRVRVALRDPVDASAPTREVTLRRWQPAPAWHASAPIAESRPGVMYVDLGRASDSTVNAAMPRLAAARAIVFDMRGYPPRDLRVPRLLAMLGDSSLYSANMRMPLLTRPDREGVEYHGAGWRLLPNPPRLRARVAFLSGPGSVSHAESILGVVEENRLGAIVGETSAGTNGDVNSFVLPGGYAVYFTGLRVEKRDGTPHHGTGIRPTVPAAPTIRGVREGRDDVLERALDFLARP